MPCRDDGYDTYVDREKERRFQDLTRMLCAVMETIGNFSIDGKVIDLAAKIYKIKGLNDWWEEHEEKDRERIKREALAKLSQKEKEVLGLK